MNEFLLGGELIEVHLKLILLKFLDLKITFEKFEAQMFSGGICDRERENVVEWACLG